MLNFTLLFQDQPKNDSSFLIIIIGVFLVAMFAFSIIPQRRKQKKMMEMSSRIQVGDKIKTAGGIFGDIIAVNEDNGTYIIRSGDTTFEIDRGFVYSMEMLGFAPQNAHEQEVGAVDGADALEDISDDASDAVVTDAADTVSEDEIKKD